MFNPEIATTEKLLTVTVPAYNAEAYLDTCLTSLCQEEVLGELEVLVIDDGSTDGTGAVAERYAARYPETVRVIHKENGGHGSGINRGAEEARGTYFKVVDADDWVEREAFLHLMEFLRETEADIAASGFLWAYDDGSGNPESFRKKAEFKEPFPGVRYWETYRFDDIADRLYVKMHAMTIKTELLRKAVLEAGLRLDEHCYYVDAEYILYPIPYVETISFLPDFVYMYRIGRQGQSVSLSKMRKNEENYRRVLQSLFRFYDRCRMGGTSEPQGGGQLSCSKEKCAYIAGIIARVAAGNIKICLSFPDSRGGKQRLLSFDRELREKYPDIYRANRNKAVAALRKSHYLLYPLAVRMLKDQNKGTK